MYGITCGKGIMTVPGDQESGTPPEGRPTIWDRLDRPPRGPKPSLTHDQIAEAAIEIADAQGIDAVSMRRLAERLGVATMALYRYVASKSDVFELMLDAVHTRITPPAEGGWREISRAYAEQTRTVVLGHPWLIQVYARTPNVLTPNMVTLLERFLVSVDGLGIDVDSMMAVFGTLNAFVRGATAAEVALRELAQREGWTSDHDMRMAYLPYIRRLMESGRYPTVTRYIVEGSNEDDSEWTFGFGLECVLDGLATRLGI
jgi:AcrR family transcriptional regulator